MKANVRTVFDVECAGVVSTFTDFKDALLRMREHHNAAYIECCAGKRTALPLVVVSERLEWGSDHA